MINLSWDRTINKHNWPLHLAHWQLRQGPHLMICKKRCVWEIRCQNIKTRDEVNRVINSWLSSLHSRIREKIVIILQKWRLWQWTWSSKWASNQNLTWSRGVRRRDYLGCRFRVKQPLNVCRAICERNRFEWCRKM